MHKVSTILRGMTIFEKIRAYGVRLVAYGVPSNGLQQQEGLIILYAPNRLQFWSQYDVGKPFFF